MSLLLLVRCSPKSMRLFIIHNLVAFSVMVPLYLSYHHFFLIPFAEKINSFSVVFEFSFLSLFLTFHMSTRMKKNLLIIVFLVCLFWILFILITSNQESIDYTAFSVSHFGLLIFSIFFLGDFFKKEIDKKISDYPEFFVSIGVFVLSSISLPVIIIADFVGNEFIKQSTFLCILTNTSFTIFHLFLIYSFLCSIKKK